MPQGDESGASDGGEQDEVDVVLDERRDRRDEADQVAEHREPEAPQDRADEVVERVAPPRHVADAGSDRGEGAHDRHEPGEDDGEPAVFLEERVRAVDVLLAEQARVFPLEDRRTALVADVVPDLAAEERGETDEQRDPPDAQTEDTVRERVGRVREQPRDHEQRVARQQETDQQTGLGEDDETHHQQCPGACAFDDGRGVEPRDEGQRVHGGPVSVGGRGRCRRRRRLERNLRHPVRKVGLEPTRPKAQEPKSCVSADFTTPASGFHSSDRVWRG